MIHEPEPPVYTHPDDIDLDAALRDILGPELTGGQWVTAVERMAGEIRRLRSQRSDLLAERQRVRELAAELNDVSSATTPDSLFEGTEEAELAWRMAWRAASAYGAIQLGKILGESTRNADATGGDA